jgi:hypothetical protein
MAGTIEAERRLRRPTLAARGRSGNVGHAMQPWDGGRVLPERPSGRFAYRAWLPDAVPSLTSTFECRPRFVLLASVKPVFPRGFDVGWIF